MNQWSPQADEKADARSEADCVAELRGWLDSLASFDRFNIMKFM